MLLTEQFLVAHKLLQDSMLPCFALTGDQTASQLRERFQPTLTHSLVEDYVNKLIDSSLGSHWTRLYDSVRLCRTTPKHWLKPPPSINITLNRYYRSYSCEY